MTAPRYECCFYADLRPTEITDAIERALFRLEPWQQKSITDQAERLVKCVKARNPKQAFSPQMALEAIVKIALNEEAMIELERRVV